MNTYSIAKKYSGCRVCGNQELLSFFTLDNLPMPEGHTDRPLDAFTHPITINWCSECRMVQTSVDLDLEEYYEGYVYTTGLSPQVEYYMESFAKELISKYEISERGKVLEVGSGDGVQLEKFLELGFEVVGVEPSHPLAAEAERRGVETEVALFDQAVADKILSTHGPVSAVIIQYTFDHLPIHAASRMMFFVFFGTMAF